MKNITNFINESCANNTSSHGLNYKEIYDLMKEDHEEDYWGIISSKFKKDIKKFLEKYKEYEFEEVERYNMYSSEDSIGGRIFDDNGDWIDKGDNITEDESVVGVFRVKGKRYFVDGLNPDECVIYLLNK